MNQDRTVVLLSSIHRTTELQVHLPHPFPNRDVKRFEVLGSRINQHIQNHTNSSELFSSRFAADIALFCKEAGLVFIAESTT